MNKLAHTIASLLAILIILVALFVIVILIHYALYGNPIADTGHIINDIKGAIR